MRGHLHPQGNVVFDGQAVWITILAQNVPRDRFECSPGRKTRRTEEYRCRKVMDVLSMCCPDAESRIRTFRALSDKHLIFSKLEDVADELGNDMVSGGWTGKTVTLKYKLDTYQGNSHSPASLEFSSD